MLSAELKVIDESIASLIEKGELIKRKFIFANIEDFDSSLGDEFEEFFAKLRSRFGNFLALDLLDMGLRRRITPIIEGKPIVLHVSLPADLLAEFSALQVNGEQGVAPNP